MKSAELEEVLAWVRSTDLVEVALKEGGRGFSLATAESQPAPSLPLPASRFTVPGEAVAHSRPRRPTLAISARRSGFGRVKTPAFFVLM